MMKDRLISLRELSEQLGGVPEKTIRNKISDGTWPIRPVRIGRTLRWRQSEVSQLISGEVTVPPSRAR